MRTAKKGDTVRVHCTGQFDDGSGFSTANQEEPLEFTIGAGNVTTSFENFLIGMEEGDRRTFRLSPEQAMGERKPELVKTIPRFSVEQGEGDLKVGDFLRLRGKDGEPMKARVVSMTQEEITIDANHPLAGQPITFDVDLIEIV